MTYEYLTTLDGPSVLARAKAFFAQRVPLNAAFPEREGDGWLVLRGQGGEEVAIAVVPSGDAVRVRGSTLFFDQALDRFLSTLPPVDGA
jgi:hypothetical protein